MRIDSAPLKPDRTCESSQEATPRKKRNRELEKDLRRKEKTLAESAVLLVLQYIVPGVAEGRGRMTSLLFSGPRVSDDNTFVESLFRTLKHGPIAPPKRFTCIGRARAWVAKLMSWYNTEHLHSPIRFVTPA